MDGSLSNGQASSRFEGRLKWDRAGCREYFGLWAVAFDSLMQVESDFWLIGVQIRFSEAYEVCFEVIHVVKYWMKIFKLIVVSDAVEITNLNGIVVL